VSNDPENHVVTLSLSGIVIASARVVPSNLWIDRVVSGSIIKKEFEVYAPDDTTFSITEIKTSDGIHIQKKRERIENGNKIIPFSVTLNILSPIGSYNKKIKLITNKHNKIIEIPIEGEIIGPIEAAPSAVFLGEIKHGTKFEKRIALRPIRENALEPFDINLIVKSHVRGTANIDAIIEKKEGELLLLVTGKKDQKSKNIEGFINIYNVNQEKILVVPIYESINGHDSN
jgi:hypothetical protein